MTNKEASVQFAEWLSGNGWQHYDGADRWINLEGRTVCSTGKLYDKMEKEMEAVRKFREEKAA